MHKMKGCVHDRALAIPECQGLSPMNFYTAIAIVGGDLHFERVFILPPQRCCFTALIASIFYQEWWHLKPHILPRCSSCLELANHEREIFGSDIHVNLIYQGTMNLSMIICNMTYSPTHLRAIRISFSSVFLV